MKPSPAILFTFGLCLAAQAGPSTSSLVPVAPTPHHAIRLSTPRQLANPLPPMMVRTALVQIVPVVTNYLTFSFLLPSYDSFSRWGIDESHDLVNWSNIMVGSYPNRCGAQLVPVTWVNNYALMTATWSSTSKVGYYRLWSNY